MRVTANGNIHDVKPGTTLALFLSDLGIGGEPLAVERNRQVVPRREHRQLVLEEGDVLEIVTLVGGG